MTDVFKKIMTLLSRRERRRFYVLVGIMIFVAFAEVFGISAFLILLRVLAEPERIFENPYLTWGYNAVGIEDPFTFQVVMAVAVFLVMALSLVIKAGGNYAIIRFSTMRGYTISSRLLQAYLHQPYAWFLQRNSADVAKSVLGEVQNVVNKIITPGGQLLANGILTITIIGFLIAVDPVIAVMAALLLGGAYTGIYFWLRAKLLVIGEGLLKANTERFRLTNEATGGFKEVKLMSLENRYVERFREPAQALARNAALSQVMNQIPRFALEGLTFAVLFGIILVMLLRSEGNLSTAIPVLGVFGISAMRLLPAMQQVYGAFANIRSAKPVLDNIYRDYTDAIAHGTNPPRGPGDDADLSLDRDLVLKGIGFSYASGDRPAVHNVDMEIPALSTIGIVGGTGAGKTTLVDLILGLLMPDTGQIIVDGEPLTADNMHRWRRSIGYVPQTIYLTDSSVAQNIAFGVPEEAIDPEAMERAARAAALHDFVMEEMPQQYDTIVGERGVRLSGGQRQRIGIARALYHDPSLLIFDEATSALDNLTERAVMDAVQRIRNTKTVIMIAHRLSTIRKCDRIFLLEHGTVQASGSYEDLVDENETFRKMAAV
ncbi:ABC-type bacteriocin/lantibiotic exporter with double-glycine peptidase domain [Roseovarius halotolerans]|uniref:Heterocyst differentiation ATP-binding protein HepA n=2 Tax=Roseovarius halotolerans TaxID=505353 RepID=A0A1X6Z310_9RHOB|nr:ABC transporter ATP-binding protein [Roseovarius halotolerans]RKT32335.1 ABC-type bacteriocin/lantibiotic exporter with double-glycine peptidase domain [Roseovarius halotolerans]SLN38615.1 Heterocyst differentiation ATP-binding protein HepA [Roseovarius halotolerans]